jgi:hypothetical protein
MQPRIKVGLLVGAIGLALNICIAGAVGLCGPLVSLTGGALAGFFTAKQENPVTKADGARAGAISGSIAGILILVGQMIGALGVLILVQVVGPQVGAQMPFGQIPATTATASEQLLYYASGVGTGCCFGLTGTVLAALVGAGTGYLGTPDQPPAASNM